MKIEIKNELFLTSLSDKFSLEIISRLTIPNPAFQEAERMGRWTGNMVRDLKFYRRTNEGLAIPRGFLVQLINMARSAGESVEINDYRWTMPEVDFIFRGQLRDFQRQAVADMLNNNFGTLNAPTGSGKTVMALAIIAARRQPTLIIVHNKELLNQWIDRIGQFLDIPKTEIGQIGAGKKVIGRQITVGIINSIYPIAAPLLKHHIGHLVVDECHRTPSRTFTEAVSAFDCRYLLGLSATPYRRDGLTKLISWHLGDCRHNINRNELEQTGDIVPAEVIFRHTQFNSLADPSNEYTRMLSELTEDRDRNIQITADVVREARNGGGACLILTDRKEHAETLGEYINACGVHAEKLTGDMSAKDRQAIVERLNSGSVKVLVATGQLIGEGFDCKGLSTLFMATPISYHGRLIQYLGRVLRPAPGKSRAKVYDYIDPCGVLQASASKRQSIYRNNKWAEVTNEY